MRVPFFSRGVPIVNSPSAPSRLSGGGNWLGLLGQYIGKGGYKNDRSGAGGSSDKTAWRYFLPTLNMSREILETAYVESWVARKMIDAPVDDMLIRWRAFVNVEDEDAVETMQRAEKDHKIKDHLRDAMICGRLYGTGLLIPVTRESPMEEPIDMDRLGEGDLANIIVSDRFYARVVELDPDIYSPTYEQPLRYEITRDNFAPIIVHASRVIRFDGIKPPGRHWSVYQQEGNWGLSTLIPVMSTIYEDAALVNAISHLTEESSMLVIAMKSFRDMVAGEQDLPRGNPLEALEANLQLRSIYRTMIVDAGDQVSRVGVNFGGLPELIDRFNKRVAAGAGMPGTRFMGQSPVGLNATGESDTINYAIFIGALQQTLLTGPLDRLDAILAADAGLKEPLEYEWLSLIDLSDQDQATVLKTKAEALALALESTFIQESEGREVLNGDPVIGRLREEDAPDWEAMAEEEQANAEAMLQAAQAQQESDGDDEQESESDDDDDAA